MAMAARARTDSPRLLWAPQAWVDGRWQAAVVLTVGSDGRWARVETGQPCPDQAERLDRPVIPALVDAHSHAFQRAFAGLAESRSGAHDDFWSWRERMYAVAQRITPAQLRAVAAHLYAELLAGGYTEVCEFHYLHHALPLDLQAGPSAVSSEPEAGAPLATGRGAATDADRPLAMAQALIDAAADAGIALTLLPVLYQRAGFGAPGLRPQQARFAADAGLVLAQQAAVQAHARQRGGPASAWPPLAAGVAIHSLRAAEPAALAQVAAGAGDGPIHIHVAEQTAEVDDCLAATGCRPIEWLTRHAALDARWQLVHATHSTPAEIDAVAARGAGVVLCPSTEANLGDGLADLPGWLAAGVALSLGSDSQVTRAWPEELRWLEYGQRLARRQRNVAAAAATEPATAARLFERMGRGGAAAAGQPLWGLQRGARADLLVLDADEPALAGVPAAHTLDALVFAAPARPFARVLVAGRWVTGQAQPRAALQARFAAAMAEIWGG
jgi:formimidoylglutamate deiminase